MTLSLSGYCTVVPRLPVWLQKQLSLSFFFFFLWRAGCSPYSNAGNAQLTTRVLWREQVYFSPGFIISAVGLRTHVEVRDQQPALREQEVKSARRNGPFGAWGGTRTRGVQISNFSGCAVSPPS